MSTTIDNMLAFKILYMLVTPFEKTDAYKFGIIDKDGTPLKKSKDLKSSEEKDSYTNLDRLVFSLKRLLGKVPGGKSQLASLVAAYWLIKESHQKRTVVKEEELLSLIDLIEEKKLTLVEEELDIEKFIAMMEDGGAAIANTAGAATATDKPVVKLNKKNKPISGILGLPDYIARRKQPVQMGQK
jgi:hypothetical protein